jgi:predicted Abi (CAAX) family protease
LAVQSRSLFAWLAAAPGRVWRGVATWPGRAAWGETAVVALPVFVTMAIFGFGGGVFRFAAPAPDLLKSLAVAFFAPALGEELLFRALLVPDARETGRPYLSLVVSTAAFVAWHPVEAHAWLPKALPLFSDMYFLCVAAALGLGCGWVRWRTSSVWPAVAMHWIAVATWQAFLGGPGLEALR